MCSCSVLFSYSEIPAFEINSPEEVEVINDNNHEIKFQERFNAAKELIWVLPSNINGKYIDSNDMYAWSFFNDYCTTSFFPIGVIVKIDGFIV